jgi:hypothetical protein
VKDNERRTSGRQLRKGRVSRHNRLKNIGSQQEKQGFGQEEKLNSVAPGLHFLAPGFETPSYRLEVGRAGGGSAWTGLVAPQLRETPP